MTFSYADEVVTVGDLRRFLAFIDREGIPDNAKLSGRTKLFRGDMTKLSVSGIRSSTDVMMPNTSSGSITDVTHT